MLTGRSGDAAVCRFRWVSGMTLSALRVFALARGKETVRGGRQTPASRQSRTARSKPSAYRVSCPRLEVVTREERKSSGSSVQCSQQAGMLRVAVTAPQHKQRRGDAPESVWVPLITRPYANRSADSEAIFGASRTAQAFHRLFCYRLETASSSPLTVSVGHSATIRS